MLNQFSMSLQVEQITSYSRLCLTYVTTWWRSPWTCSPWTSSSYRWRRRCIARRWRRTPGSWSLNTWPGVPLPSTASWLTQTNPFFANGKMGRSHFSSMLKDENHCWECVTQIRTFRTQFQGCVERCGQPILLHSTLGSGSIYSPA